MIDGVARFQKAEGLKVDGVMNPGGETEGAVDRALKLKAEARKMRDVRAGRSKASARSAPEGRSTPDSLIGFPQGGIPKRAGLLVQREAPSTRNPHAAPPSDGLRGTRLTDAEPRGLIDPVRSEESENKSGSAQHSAGMSAGTGVQAPERQPSRNNALKPADDGKWRNVDTTLHRRSAEFVTKGRIRVDLINRGLHLDGLRYNVQWAPLDADGRERAQIMNEGSLVEEHGGHGLPLGTSSLELKPPFHNPHGWKVRIVVAPQASASGNSASPYLNIFRRDK
jgi:hypothetical protein